MTWVCDAATMLEPRDCDEVGGVNQPTFIDTLWIESDPCDRFSANASEYFNARNVTTGTERDPDTDVYCVEHGEMAINYQGFDLLRKQLEYAIEVGWRACSHGIGERPVLLNCEDCLEEHINRDAHGGLVGRRIYDQETINETIATLNGTLVFDPLDLPMRNRTPPRMPATITVNNVVSDYVVGRGYVPRRRPPRTLHDMIGGTDG